MVIERLDKDFLNCLPPICFSVFAERLSACVCWGESLKLRETVCNSALAIASGLRIDLRSARGGRQVTLRLLLGIHTSLLMHMAFIISRYCHNFKVPCGHCIPQSSKFFCVSFLFSPAVILGLGKHDVKCH